MTIFFELVTDPFEARFDEKVARANDRRRAGVERVRRPLRGLEIKDDTYAILKLISSNGEEIRLLDSSSKSGESTQYANFILQSVTEARMEKHQILDTFGEPYLYLFGEHPRFLDVSAMLIDSFDFNWYGEWWENYNRYLRGTRSVELGARTYLFYDDNIVEGYMLQASSQKTSDAPLMASLSFRLFLTNYSNVTMVSTSGRYPVRPGVGAPNVRLIPLPSPRTGDPTSLSGALRSLQGTTGSIGQRLGSYGALLEEAGVDPNSNPLRDAQRSFNTFRDYTGLVANAAGAVENVVSTVSNIFGNTPGRTRNFYRDAPLRSDIADNDDEFTGPYPFSPDPPQEAKKRNPLADVHNLATSVIVAAKQIGAVVDNYQQFADKMGIIDRAGDKARNDALVQSAQGTGTRRNTESDRPTGKFAMNSTKGEM